ncbi:N-formimino-L-glutamate deiminase [Sphingomonas sp. Leaf33]|uniref:formimidoylglutamate deiminase n=1 Tax=Sphingomonas sp. Leaf33 TaxID=1736215 RepID=UPI0006F5D452|nr:formimidoylglutamate deiminase [Sphingomonas sp. Leaf33]KQN26351.1 N-formimino-L-glutamate deiminase [Sphingomonas sp. Leaf33]
MPTFFFDQWLGDAGWLAATRVAVSDGRVTAVEPHASPGPTDERHAIGLPGLPNLHSHAFQRGMAGLAERGSIGEDSFWTWRDAMYRFVDRITPDDLHAIAAMAQVEMLEGGFTRVGEFHYLHHAPDGQRYDDPAAMAAALAAAAGETGIGLTLLPVFYAQSGFGGAAPSAGQRRFVTDRNGFARLLDASASAVAGLPDAVAGIAPHSLRAVSPDDLAALPGMTAGPVHIHIAEQVKEVDDCVAWSGARPVEWLLDHAAVDPRWCLVHATHMTPAETDRAARTGAVAGLCPITEANLGDGIFPAIEWLAAGGRFGVGSDSNVLIDATEELRLLDYGQRLTRRVRNPLAPGGSSGARLYRSALAGGAQALSAPGDAADFITLDPHHPALVGRSGDALLDALVFAAGRSAIDGVWRRGRQVVAGGRHIAREAIAARYRHALERLLA